MTTLETETQTCMVENCDKPAECVRKTQFAGDHYYCRFHAKQEEDFFQENPSYFFWIDLRVNGVKN